MEISGRTVLLTGATGGIGHAIARALHGAGAKLVLSGRRTDVLEPLAAETRRRVARRRPCRPRGRRPPAPRHPATSTSSSPTPALPASGDLYHFSVEEIDRALDVNLRAPIVLARGSASAWPSAARATSCSSPRSPARRPRPAQSIYSATKFGLRGFALGLRADLVRRGVGVSTVFPGFIRDAGMFAESGTKLPAVVGTSTPEEVAAAVVRAIERDRAEVDVAPLGIRAGRHVGRLAPRRARVSAAPGREDREADGRGQRSKR